MERDLKILVVDDSEPLRELYVEWLERDADIETAANGTAAMNTIDESVDLLLLDREMPGPNGRDVATELDEQGYDVHIVMVSSLPPDFDIIEYPIDGYLQKPASESDIRSIIEQYRRQRKYHEALEEYFSLTSKLAAIEAQLSPEQRQQNEEYEQLKERVAQKRAEVDEAIDESTTDWDFTFKSCARAIEAD